MKYKNSSKKLGIPHGFTKVGIPYGFKKQLAGISFPDNLVESTMLRHDMHVGTVKIFSGGNDKESCTTLCNFF